MAPLRLKSTVAACAIALLCGGALAGCGKDDEPGVDEPAREGLAIDVDGIDYNVFITRELNLDITPDKAYYKGPPASPGQALYGIFLQACNHGKKPRHSTEDFVVEDNQGTEFAPIEMPADNAFAYKARELLTGECIPEAGSVAQLGPTAGSMLLFRFPLTTTENRPLELVIKGSFDFAKGARRDTKRVELDL